MSKENNATTKPFYNSTIPNDWKLMELEKITEKIGDGLHGTPEYVSSSNYFFINGNNLKKGVILINADTKCVSNEEYKKHKKDLKYKSILLSINGTIGSVAFYKNENIVLGKSTAYINCKDENVDFLFHYLQSQSVINFFEGELTGSTIRNLSLKSIREIPIPLPPLPEQRAIAHVLSLMDSVINQNNQLISQKELQKKWLMQNLLTGKKRLKGFGGEWKEIHIRDISKEVSIRNKADKQLTVLSCTKYNGLVESLEYWGRKIFADDISTYKIVPKNHFAYATNHIEEGSIGYQDSFDEALISPMYTVFKTDSSINDLYFYKLLKSHMLIYQYQNRMEGSIDRRGDYDGMLSRLLKFVFHPIQNKLPLLECCRQPIKKYNCSKPKPISCESRKRG